MINIYWTIFNYFNFLTMSNNDLDYKNVLVKMYRNKNLKYNNYLYL